MASPQIQERFRGITGDANQRVISYLVENALSDEDALDQVEIAAPSGYDLLTRTNARVREITKKAYRLREYDPANYPGEFIEEQDVTVRDGSYYVDVIYTKQTASGSSPTVPEDKFNLFSFEQSLETARVYQAKYGTTVYNSDPSPGPAAPASDPFPMEGINRTKEKYDGADIRLPIGSYSYDFFPGQTEVNQAYFDRVQQLVGTVNSDAFENAEAGEILFVSATGRRRANQSDWELNYKFEYRQNIVGEVLDVAGAKAIKYDKDGHDYMWVYYLESARPTGAETAPIPVPVQVNVEQVYPRDTLWSKLFVDLLP